MAPLLAFATLALSILFVSINAQVNYTDIHVLPTPHKDYVRYLTLFGNGSRTYTCDPSSGSDNYTLTDLNYNLYPAEPTINTTFLVGRRVFLTIPDYNAGNFVFYTKILITIHTVGKVVKTEDDPAATSPFDLPEDLEIFTERSEPKPYQTDLDLAIANFVTRYGAVGGALPAELKCTSATATYIAPGRIIIAFGRELCESDGLQIMDRWKWQKVK